MADRGKGEAEVVADIREGIEKLPRVSLADLPTPLQECPRLSEALGGPRILIKRDDLTGLATGGNKTRYLEFTIADALKEGADTLVLSASVQSNHARQLAAAAAKLGLDVRLLLLVRGTHGEEIQGNLLLEDLLGARITLLPIDKIDRRQAILQEIVDALRQNGRHPYLMDNERAALLSAVAYTNAGLELATQLREMDVGADYVWMASTGGTVTGHLVAGKALNTGWRVVTHAYHPVPAGTERSVINEIAERAAQVSDLLGLPLGYGAGDFDLHTGYVGEAFEAVAPWSADAVRCVAETEGIIIEPLYTGRAVASLAERIRAGEIGPDRTVVLIHTGGIPNLFYYGHELASKRWAWWEE